MTQIYHQSVEECVEKIQLSYVIRYEYFCRRGLDRPASSSIMISQVAMRIAFIYTNL